MSAWREAFRSMSMRLIAAVWLGTLALGALGAIWLQIPDSHIWEFALSIVSACAWVALAFWFCCWVFHQTVPAARKRWWLGWILLAVVILVWWLLQIPIDRLAEKRDLFAGYLTSQLPRGLRGARTFEHLRMWQDWLYFTLRLVVAGLLLPVAVLAGVGAFRDDLKRIFSVWFRWWYWVAALVCGWIAFEVSGRLMSWTHERGLAKEILSALLRLGFCYTLDVLLMCFVLALVGVAVQRATKSSAQL